MLSSLIFVASLGQCLNGPCKPGNEFCGKPFQDAPMFHLMDQHGCGENDPNGPVFDPVHGVIHHFYQIHLAAAPGHGPDYGHFVSKDFINWAALPVAIWNGIDVSSGSNRVTKYDNEAIYTGSATVVDGAGPGGKGPGVVNLYPGLCNNNDWPGCATGTLLALAIPADYATDELLTNWSKPSFNPIIENTQRDPASPWKTPAGEWRFRTYDSKVYGAASDADFLAGKFYDIGVSKDLRTAECPSFYPLPGPTPGTEAAYKAGQAAGTLPNHVHKTSAGGDWWQVGTYVAGPPKTLGTFQATPGWEDVFAQRRIDTGNFYASKDNIYPTKAGDTRRINWGWATVPPASAQTLPREITFNAEARALQQYPIDEYKQLRGAAANSAKSFAVKANVNTDMKIAAGVVRQSEVVATFAIPSVASSFGITIGKSGAPPPPPPGTTVGTYMVGTDLPGNDLNITHYPTPKTDPKVCEAACDADSKCAAWTYVIRGDPAGSGDCCLKTAVGCPTSGVPACTSGAKKATTLPNCGGGGGGGSSVACQVHYVPPTNKSANYPVQVSCGGVVDTLVLTPSETTIELRIYSDWTFVEAFFQQGRVAMTAVAGLTSDDSVLLTSTVDTTVAQVDVYPVKQIWTTPDAVRNAPRVYNTNPYDDKTAK